ncbi:hypothetical protein Slin15195_G059950 [Septoria linicola]|uniref:Uncharacterized protein n=1 Tax=Septoria linicola TaxID=215465 RepID=A0A9Q9AXY9_9PEZI|nr:hypothetical protein Slin14017_G075800 [Septoria linicola]USW52676.1 hypothetical protein Slin15195_G059950 [Septoria linicola]
MFDAPEMSPCEIANEYEHEAALSRAAHAAQARQQAITRRATASLVERQAIRNAIANNRAARTQAVSMVEVDGGDEATEPGAEADKGKAITRKEASQGRAEWVFMKALGVLIVVVLLYAFFCWINWPEMSYIRKRRREVLGL